MASTSENIPSSHHQDINYDVVKNNYMNMVTLHKHELKPLCTRDSIEETISHITVDPSSAQNFKVKTVNGKKKLLLKNTKKTLVEVIPVEDSFDVLLDAHVACNHGGPWDTYEEVKKGYSVHILCARWIVASCDVCNLAKGVSHQPTELMRYKETVKRVLKNPAGSPRTRGLWRLNILKDITLAEKSDRVSFLLILKEDTTNFLVLRPLSESTGGFALELMKVFTEFGYPEKVCVPNLLDFYKMIFHLVYLMNPAGNVPVEQVTNIDVFEKDKAEVLREIINWKKMTDDSYWEQSCHIVQYKLNTTSKVFTRLYGEEEFIGVPFNQFFEYRYRTPMTWIPSPFVQITPDLTAPNLSNKIN